MLKTLHFSHDLTPVAFLVSIKKWETLFHKGDSQGNEIISGFCLDSSFAFLLLGLNGRSGDAQVKFKQSLHQVSHNGTDHVPGIVLQLSTFPESWPCWGWEQQLVCAAEPFGVCHQHSYHQMMWFKHLSVPSCKYSEELHLGDWVKVRKKENQELCRKVTVLRYGRPSLEIWVFCAQCWS